ncbi:MAG TPA: hypothetical protein VI894_01260 [Candidatus Nanoarchaeia archaeon]|nr:hypothetical protein [Candidatus Nanoarchaeia archaeon]
MKMDTVILNEKGQNVYNLSDVVFALAKPTVTGDHRIEKPLEIEVVKDLIRLAPEEAIALAGQYNNQEVVDAVYEKHPELQQKYSLQLDPEMAALSQRKTKKLEINNRLETLISKYSENPERGRRFIKLAAKLIKTSNEELNTYIKNNDNSVAGIYQSLLHTRGEYIKNFDKQYGGTFIEVKHDKKLIFSGENAGEHAKFSGTNAGWGAYLPLHPRKH